MTTNQVIILTEVSLEETQTSHQPEVLGGKVLTDLRTPYNVGGPPGVFMGSDPR